jgi:hypothetical protein
MATSVSVKNFGKSTSELVIADKFNNEELDLTSPFNAPVINIGSYVTVTSGAPPMVVAGTLIFDPANTFQSWKVDLSDTQSIEDGFSLGFTAARQAGSAGLTWTMGMQFSGFLNVLLTYQTHSGNPAFYDKLQVSVNNSVIFDHNEAFWPTDTSSNPVVLTVDSGPARTWSLTVNGVPVPGITGVAASALVTGRNYVITSVGTTDFVPVGANVNAATALSAGIEVAIYSVGTTDFTLIGAPNNNVGTIFTPTGPGTGTGTVIQTQFVATGTTTGTVH